MLQNGRLLPLNFDCISAPTKKSSSLQLKQVGGLRVQSCSSRRVGWPSAKSETETYSNTFLPSDLEWADSSSLSL